MNPTAPANPNTHPIKVVAKRTGLSAHVIRIWEKRYNAVTPVRTDTNRRRYTDRDIARFALLKRATEGGHSIGQIANLTDEQLRALIAQDRPTSSPLENPAPDLLSEDNRLSLQPAIKAVEEMNGEALYTALSQAAVDFNQLDLIETVITPLMHRIGDLWREGKLRIAHEHLAYAVVRGFLENLNAAYASSPDAPNIVVATPSGQLHELGALIAAAVATTEGWQVTYLGASLPAEEIALAARKKNARAVALSVVYPGDDPQLNAELYRLHLILPDGVVLLVGGRVSAQYRTAIEAIGGIEIRNARDLSLHLQTLRDGK